VKQSVADSSARTFQPGIAVYLSFCHNNCINPLSPSAEDIVLFATDLSHSRCLSTIRVYLAAVRFHLLSHAASIAELHSPRLTAVLRGLERTQGPARLARREITMPDLEVVKAYLERSNYSNHDQAMLWSSITTAFYGLLRASEFLASDALTVEPDRTLTWSSITATPSVVFIQLKRTKTAQDGHGGTVELRPTSNFLCPVQAFCAHSDNVGDRAKGDNPVFTFQSGKHLTRDELTRMLRHALQTTTVSSHSLRIGGATNMANCGASEAQVRRAGRWRSSACDRYVRQNAGMPTL